MKSLPVLIIALISMILSPGMLVTFLNYKEIAFLRILGLPLKSSLKRR